MATWTKETINLNISSASLTVDNIKIDGTTIGHTDDTDLLTLTNGSLAIAGTVTGVTTLAASGNVTVGGTLVSTGTITGTLATAAQTNITSLGTLTALQVDNINLNTNTINATSGDLTITAAGGDISFGNENLTTTGNLDVDGTTNLDAVDIDGNVQLDGTLTVGVDGTGYDVKLFGDTASNYMLWDTSTDRLDIYSTGSSSTLDSLRLIHTDTDANAGPRITMRRISNDALNDILGQVSFSGDDDGDGETSYSSIRGQVGASSGAMAAGAEEGALNLSAMSNGTSRSGILIKGTASDTVDIDIGYGAASLTKVKGYFAANGATPAAAPDYTVNNKTGTTRTIDCDGTDTAVLAENVGQLINDLIAIGLLQ